MGTTDPKPYVGGQAVIEGVMMRAPRSLAIAVRRPDGSIAVREDEWVSLWEKLAFLRWPLLRGTVVLIESMYNGIQALNFAAHQASALSTDGAETARSEKSVVFTIVLGAFFAIALFIALPHLMATGSGHVMGSAAFDPDGFAFHALDGIYKIGIFVGYIAGISLIPEIRRVFEYHGAEHKVVNVYEGGLDLSVENARAQTTFHARCGTSFVLFVLTLSVFMFAAVFALIPPVSDIAVLNHLAMIGLKIPLMLPIAGIAYEVNRFAAKHPGRIWVQALVLPGRLMQKLTTREPADDQLEIALTAMRAALRHEVEVSERSEVDQAEPLPAGAQVAVFRSYGDVAAAIQSGS